MIRAATFPPHAGAPPAHPDRPRSRSAADAWGRALVLFIVMAWGAGLFVGFQTAVIILLAAAFAAVVLGVRYPALGLLGLGMLSALDAPARVFLLTGGLLRWNTINYWLLAVIVLSLRRLLRIRDAQTRALELFVLLLGVELLGSPDPRLGAQHLLGIAVFFAYLLYFARAAVDHEVWRWLGAVTGTLGAAGGLVFYLQMEQLPYINPNAWAYLPLAALFAICLAFHGRSHRARDALLLMALAAVNLVWVFLSGSRGGLLIGLFCGAYLLLRATPLRRRLGSLAVAALIVLLISSQFSDLQAAVVERIHTLLDPQRALVSRTSGRSDLALAGWHIFLSHPLGVGTGGFAAAWVELGDLGGALTFHRVGEETQAHSGWVKTLAENGLPGILLLGAYLLSFVLIGRRRSAVDSALRPLGLLAAGALAIAFISTEFQAKALWLLAAGASTHLRAAGGRHGRRR